MSDTWPQYSDMTPDQMLAWGLEEIAARQADLTIKTAGSIKAAQKNADARRKLIGASLDAASAMVVNANRQKRRNELRSRAASSQDAQYRIVNSDTGCRLMGYASRADADAWLYNHTGFRVYSQHTDSFQHNLHSIYVEELSAHAESMEGGAQ